MAKTLMPRRTNAERTAKPKAAPKPSAVAELIAERAGMVQRLEYEPLGRLIQMQVALGLNNGGGDETKWIEFRRRNKGPSIGRLSDGTVELIDPWPGLDDRLVATKELCPDCLAPCDECGEIGWRLCTLCGGAKEVKDSEEACACVKRKGRFDPACKKCRGSGSLVVLKACPRCVTYETYSDRRRVREPKKFTPVMPAGGARPGKIECPECLGGGKMSTGHLNGAMPSRSGQVCLTCEGYGRKLQRIPQDLDSCVVVHEGGYYVGPILGLMVKPVGEYREPEAWIASADTQGKYLYLASTGRFAAGTRVAFVGGIVVPQPGSNA